MARRERKRANDRAHDARRRAEQYALRRLYKGSAWASLRRLRLEMEPVCRMCAAEGRVTQATVVDHITEHKGDHALFFDLGNTQSLCEHHHNSTKKREEMRGYSDGLDADGWPTDPRHPANTGKLS